MSSKVIGCRSGPGSTTRPRSTVPATAVRLTVVKLTWRSPPATPSRLASRNAPSVAARMREPSTVTVIVAPPGIGASRNSIAELPSWLGTIVPASFVPSAALA